MGDRINILFGGPAGTGPNILTHVLSQALVNRGYNVFYSRDYQSLIRGGHNFNVLTFSKESVNSNDSKMDIIVCLDDKTKDLHKKELGKNGIFLYGGHKNMYFAGAVFKILGLNLDAVDKVLKKLGRRYDENIKDAKQGFNEAKKKFNLKNASIQKSKFRNGNDGIVKGAINSGIDVYYAYPMTPATSVMSGLAAEQNANDFLVIEMENEIAVANAAVGSAITGAKSMVGTAGGGFDLMSETISLTGVAKVPVVFYLAQRAGAGTGVATYNGQGDLNIALHSGHGEFNRVVLAPGCPDEAEELTNQCFLLSQEFKIPSVILGDKHLAESCYTSQKKVEKVRVKRKTKLKRYNSYEVDSEGSATENPAIVRKNVENTKLVGKEINSFSKQFDRFRVYGKKNAKNVIISWGSPKGAIIDAISGMKDIKFVQVLYMEPFPTEVIKEIKNKNVILIENNANGLFSGLLREKTGVVVDDKNKILRYDGRPFLRDELKSEIMRRMKK